VTPGVRIWQCKGCGAKVFPERLLCPRCHGGDFDQIRVLQGVVEEISVIRHMIGQANWKPRRIANVRTANGPMMTVGLQDESGPGTVIDLFEQDKAPVGRAKVKAKAKAKSK